MSDAYAALVSDSPHARKQPSDSFLAVLAELGELARRDRYGYARGIAEATGVHRPTVVRVLHRMARYELVQRWQESGTALDLGHTPRVYYMLTSAGRQLHDRIMTGVAP